MADRELSKLHVAIWQVARTATLPTTFQVAQHEGRILDKSKQGGARVIQERRDRKHWKQHTEDRHNATCTAGHMCQAE
eukprot:3417375-Pleurochrysis_carterae.AAC.2